MRHFFGFSIAFERDSAAGENLLMLILDAGGDSGMDGTGADTIYRNAIFWKLCCKRPGETDNAVLGGRIRADLGRGHQGLPWRLY